MARPPAWGSWSGLSAAAPLVPAPAASWAWGAALSAPAAPHPAGAWGATAREPELAVLVWLPQPARPAARARPAANTKTDRRPGKVEGVMPVGRPARGYRF